MSLSAELQACLSEFAAQGTVEIRENGRQATAFSGVSWEVRGGAEKPLLHLWSEHYNVTRRVIAIVDNSEQRLALAVERFGRAKPDRLEFVRVEFEHNARALSRREFCETLRDRLAEWFPDESIESLSTAADLEHSISGNYAHGLLRRGSLLSAVLAVPDGESCSAAENSLTFALLWLNRAQRLRHRAGVAGLRIILPKGLSRGLIERAAALDPDVTIEFYERDPVRETIERIDSARAGNLQSSLVLHRESQALLDAASRLLEPIVALSRNAIATHPSACSGEVWLRFRGLPFAKWHDGQIFFGWPEASEKLTSASMAALKKLVRELENARHPLATDPRHQLYRAQPERWLESMASEDVTRIDARLDPRFVYSQVLERSGGEHGILDLLTVTREGRLAILELKANEHIHLPLQAADYWLRVRRHLEARDFARYGYFVGIELQQAPPLVYLVAPALRFHPSTDVLLSYLSRELEVERVGLAEDWRRGLRVVMRR